MDTTKLKEWARKEIDLLVKSYSDSDQKEISKECEAAFHIYRDFLEEMKPDLNPDKVKMILIELLYGNVLSEIEDKEEDWELVEKTKDGDIYQSKRYVPLFKKIKYSGGKVSIKYNDTERATCVDINTSEEYTGGIGPVIIDEMFPITMPYIPQINKVTIFTEDFKVYPDSDDFDTVGVLYVKFHDGQMKEIKRFFKKDNKSEGIIEIDRTEYFARKKKAKGRRSNK